MHPSDQINDFLTGAENILVLSHVNPDGDAVCSSVAWGRYLMKRGHSITIIMPNDIPRFLKNVAGIELVHFFDSQKAELTETVQKADLIFCLDFNEIETRLGQLSEPVSANRKAKKVLIDHHPNPSEELYDAVFSDATASSTAYLVYKLIEAMGGGDMIDEGMAEAVYVGMMTDTGNFAFGNLIPDTYRVVAALVERGASPVRLYNEVFNTQTAERMKLLGYVLYCKMKLIENKGVGYITLTKEELLRFDHKQGDTEGMVNFPMSIQGIDFSVIFIETAECIRISLRSKGEHAVDVDAFARTYFTGGGHRNAAGAKSYTSMEEAVRIFLDGVDRM